MSAAGERARHWMSQGRADRAEPELRQALAEEPEDALTHALLALCLVDLSRAGEAVEEARLAIESAPDVPLSHYAMAAAQTQRGRLPEARQAINEAIRIEPHDADFWALLAQVELNDRHWNEALEAADRGLAMDPEHPDSANARAIALRQLGRNEEAQATLQQTLARDPENAVTHVNEGWRHMHTGNVAKAGEHFREALRLEPGDEAARAGLIESLKAGNRFYRGMLSFFLWMGKQSRTTVWGLLALLWLAPKFLRITAEKHPELRPFLIPVIVVLVGFAYLTWIIDPLFDMMLFWHPLGRHALTRAERLRAMLVSACLGSAIAAGGLGLAANMPGLLIPAILLLTFVIPLSAVMGLTGGKRRRIGNAVLLTLGALALGIVGFGAIGLKDGYDGWTVAAGVMFFLYLGGLLSISVTANRWSMNPQTD